MHAFFGNFILSGEARIEEVADFYGIPVADRDKALTLAEYGMRAFKGGGAGDRVCPRAVDLVVREMANGLPKSGSSSVQTVMEFDPFTAIRSLRETMPEWKRTD